MLFGYSLEEFLIIVLVIYILNTTGIWRSVVRALRELRGENVEPTQTGADTASNDLGYKMLGISPSAPWEEVERAYRTKAKIHHPDKGGDEDAMRALNDAYSRIKKLRGR